MQITDPLGRLAYVFQVGILAPPLFLQTLESFELFAEQALPSALLLFVVAQYYTAEDYSSLYSHTASQTSHNSSEEKREYKSPTFQENHLVKTDFVTS